LVEIKGEADVWIWFSPTKPIDNYILDFCYELMLWIEVDGYSHEFLKSMKRIE
jgi:very-short-patch-repair endonuclease